MTHFNKYFLLLLLASTFLACNQNEQRQETKPEVSKNNDITSAFSIEILDKEALQLIDPDAEIKIMAEGFTWTEGPLWIADGAYLLFSDIPNNKVYKMTSKGDTSTYLAPSGGIVKPGTKNNEPGSNGLLLDPKGALILMQHKDRRVAKMEAPLTAPVEKFTALTDTYKGKRFNSPNDGVFDEHGNLYFTDPPYGLPGLMNDPEKELDFQGVYFLTPSGDIKLIDKLSRPNGVALSPDENTLYVAVSDPKQAIWMKYELEAPGIVKQKKLFYDATHLVGKEGEQGLPDGLKVNQAGYIFATGAAGVWIFNPSGKPLARIHTGQRTANCAFAYNEKQLFMTADDFILSVKLK